MIRAELVDVVEVGNTLGEGVVWNPETEMLWWTDIQSSILYRYEPATRRLASFETPERLCAFARTGSPERLFCAFESGFALWTPGTSDIDWRFRLRTHPGVRLNDGRTDRQGRFWCGGLQEHPRDAEPRGQLWSVAPDGTVTAHRAAIQISNSITASPDGRALYFTDTPTRQIQRYELDPATGALGVAEEFVRTERGCYPDGSTVDAQACLWNAQWGGSKLVRYSPDGLPDFELHLPASQPTCVSFGGPDMQLLFVTTARMELDESALANESHAGDLLVYHVDVTGVADAPFGGV